MEPELRAPDPKKSHPIPVLNMSTPRETGFSGFFRVGRNIVQGFQQCYNAQLAVDGEHQIIVATEVGARVSPVVEELGQDVAELGIEAYPEFVIMPETDD